MKHMIFIYISRSDINWELNEISDATVDVDMFNNNAGTSYQDKYGTDSNQVGILSSQELSVKWFSNTKLNPSDFIDIELHHILKASKYNQKHQSYNISLNLFDCLRLLKLL